MTSVIYRITSYEPLYKTFKTRPPKLIKIERKEEERNFMSHDPYQAGCYARGYLDQLAQREREDPNFSFLAEYVTTIYE